MSNISDNQILLFEKILELAKINANHVTYRYDLKRFGNEVYQIVYKYFKLQIVKDRGQLFCRIYSIQNQNDYHYLENVMAYLHNDLQIEIGKFDFNELINLLTKESINQIENIYSNKDDFYKMINAIEARK